MGRVRPGRIVVEYSLRAQISAVRRPLGADRNLIRTVTGWTISLRVRFAAPLPFLSRRTRIPTFRRAFLSRSVASPGLRARPNRAPDNFHA